MASLFREALRVSSTSTKTFPRSCFEFSRSMSSTDSWTIPTPSPQIRPKTDNSSEGANNNNRKKIKRHYYSDKKKNTTSNDPDSFNLGGDDDDDKKRVSGQSRNPDFYRIFFRSPDNIRSLEEAQVFISHIKSSYGPLTQYQFSRCPETKRYFGYGFLTFKREDSLKKALADGFIRVGSKDFELKRSGFIPSRWTPIHRNTGFPGFYTPEELKAKRKEREMKNADQLNGEPQPISEKDSTNDNSTSEPFASALPSTFKESNSDTTEIGSSNISSGSTSSSENTKEGGSSKPFYTPLQKKGMAQLWKTIPQKIKLAEQEDSIAEDDDNSDFIQNKLEVSTSQQDSKEVSDTSKDL